MKPDKISRIYFLLISLMAAALILSLSGIQSTASEETVHIQFVFNPESYPWMLGKKYPQIAVWAAEKISGKNETIFVTKSSSLNKWTFASSRPESLPVWYSVKGGQAVDAVTSATPNGNNFSVVWKMPLWAKGKIIEFYIEANISFDYNDNYAKKLPKDHKNFNGENGQPSLIWSANLDLSKSGSVEPELIGHSHVMGKNGKIYPDLSEITTAKKLFHNIRIYKKD